MSLTCKIIRSHRRTLALEVHRDGSVIVRAPIFTLNFQITRYLKKMQSWIEKHQEKFQKVRERSERLPSPHPRPSSFTQAAIAQYKKQARERFTERLDYYAQQYGLTYKKLRLSSARTRWGSCSRQKSINLNWRLILAPAEVLDYVIAHELTHTLHMNHSKKFWAQVETMMPSHKIHKKWLRDFGRTLRT